MTLHPPLEVSAREAGGIHYLQVHGRLTIGEPSEHLNEFTQNLVHRGARKLVVNLNDIPQIDSSGISALVKLSISLARQGGGLHLSVVKAVSATPSPLLAWSKPSPPSKTKPLPPPVFRGSGHLTDFD